jgi:Ni/Co efflux regulator RcnB
MKRNFSLAGIAVLFAIAATLAVSPTLADQPEWAKGKGKGKGKGSSSASSGNGHFQDRQRVVVRDYYVQEHRSGHCPPGLAKKHNGCMPPGQAKKWKKGHPLPREVIYYEVPPTLVVQIGTPPAGHRYVRVASDILMIAIGTGMVVDAIQDLGRM